MTRVLVANLDAEAELAGQPLARRLVERLAAVGTLLGVLARDADDVLWSPAGVDPVRLPSLPWLTRPRLVHGPLPRPGSHDRLLPWCWTPRLVALGRRDARGRDRREAPAAGGPPGDDGLDARLWSLAAPTSAVLPVVAHRRFCWELSRRLGLAPERSCLLASLDALRHWLGKETGPWVLKAPFSAAGHGLLRGHGGAEALEDPLLGPRLAAAFARHRVLLAEPWLERLDDQGAVGLVDGGEVVVLGVHRLLVDADGRFRGVELAADGEAQGLPPSEAAALRQAARAAGRALAAAGHRGPFGIDAFAWRDADGARRHRPLVEVNPRLTFGHVARLLAARRRQAGAPPDGGPVALRFAKAVPAAPAPGGGWCELLLGPAPAGGDPTCAWLEGSGERPARGPQTPFPEPRR